nr:MAG TPA: hypothetical protein [Caudoviricetes sp.]
MGVRNYLNDNIKKLIFQKPRVFGAFLMSK